MLVDVGKAPQRPPPVSAQEAQLAPGYQGAQGYHVCIVVVLRKLKSGRRFLTQGFREEPGWKLCCVLWHLPFAVNPA